MSVQQHSKKARQYDIVGGRYGLGSQGRILQVPIISIYENLKARSAKEQLHNRYR